jgi:hypothetical protein
VNDDALDTVSLTFCFNDFCLLFLASLPYHNHLMYFRKLSTFVCLIDAVSLNRNEQRYKKESDLVDAFVAMGGKSDKSGRIDVAALQKVLKVYFTLLLLMLILYMSKCFHFHNM